MNPSSSWSSSSTQCVRVLTQWVLCASGNICATRAFVKFYKISVSQSLRTQNSHTKHTQRVGTFDSCLQQIYARGRKINFKATHWIAPTKSMMPTLHIMFCIICIYVSTNYYWWFLNIYMIWMWGRKWDAALNWYIRLVCIVW